MSTHLSPEQIQQYLNGGLPSDQLLTLDAHLVTCQLCQDQLRINERLATATSTLRADFKQAANAPLPHLTWEQLSALADEKLDAVEQEIAESHLKICPACTTEFAEMRQFADHLSTFPTKEFAPPVRPSWLNRMFFGFANRVDHPSNAFSLPLALKFAGVAAVIAIIIWGSTRLWPRNQISITAPKIATRETVLPSPGTTATPQPTPLETQVPSPAPPRLVLNDGGRQIALDATGKVEGINFATPADEKLASNALRFGQVESPAEVKQLRSSAMRLMGQPSEETFRLLRPTGKMIASTRPVFQWQALSGAIEYVVTLANPQTNFVLSSEPLKATQWNPPQALPRGQTYTWQVTATKDGKEIKAPPPDAPEARFRVLTQTQVDEVRRAKKTYAGNHLMLGLVYARNGLLSEAETHFKALLAANPTSALARQLLQRLRGATRG